MRYLPLLFLASSALALSPDHVFHSGSEIVAHGDFDGDGSLDIALVEVASGQFRIGLSDGSGNLTWQAARPSGIAGVTSVATGSFTTTGADQLALTSPTANRVSIISPLEVAIRPEVVSPSGIGPESLAALELPGNDSAYRDLITTTTENSAPSSDQLHIFTATSSGIVPSSTTNLSDPQRRLSSVRRLTTEPDRLAYLEVSSNNERLVTIQASELPLGAIADSVGLPGLDYEFTHAALDASDPDRNQFVCWQPGSDTIQVITPNASGKLFSAVPHALGYGPISALFPVRNASGAQIVVLVDQGARAIVLDYDGSSFTAEVELLAAAGERFTAGGSHSNDHFQLFSGRPGQPTATASSFTHDGNEWQFSSAIELSASLPKLAMGNVFLYAGEPFVDDNAELRETFHLSDWSTTFSINSGILEINRETDTGETTGLVSAPLFSGSAPVTITHALTSQPSPAYSLSGGNAPLGVLPPDISIAPPGGTYARYIQPTLTTDANGFYRTSTSQPWVAFSTTAALTLPGEALFSATVQYYAEDPVSGLKSPIFSATYAYEGLIDSDSDGVPDFVELVNGIADPSLSADTDEDGYDDLTELLAGTSPTNPADFPDTTDRLTSRGSYDLLASPLSINYIDPDGSLVIADSGTNVRAFSLQGELLAQSTYEIGSGSAPLASLPASPRGGFNVITTDTSFDTLGGLEFGSFGRELAALSPIPEIEYEPFVFQPAGGGASQQAIQWLSQYSSYLADRTKPTFNTDITYQDTLILLLTERILALKLQELEPSFDPDTLTFTPHRDPGMIVLPPLAISALQSYRPTGSVPAFRVSDIYETVKSQVEAPSDSRIVQLLSLTKEIYRLSADPTAGLTDPEGNPGLSGEFPSPFDTLRAFLQDAPITSNFSQVPIFPGAGTKTSYHQNIQLESGLRRLANNALAFLITEIEPRPDSQETMIVTADSFAGSVPVVSGIDGSVALFDGQGQPYGFPSEYQLPAGTELLVRVFLDATGLPTIPGATAREVVSIEVFRYPQPSLRDDDGNLIDDTWEAFFFSGQSGAIQPFDDPDGDGYSNLQELLEGTNPILFSSRPTTTKLPLAPPSLEITTDGGQLTLSTTYPTRFSDRVQFILQISEDLDGFAPTTIRANPEGYSTYQITLPRPAEDKQFYRYSMMLK